MNAKQLVKIYAH